MLITFRVVMLWLHLVAVFFWIGGSLCHLVVTMPGLRRATSAYDYMRLSVSLEARFRTVVWPAVGIALFTGLVNLLNTWYSMALIGRPLPGRFVQVLSIKVLLVIAMVCLQALYHFVVQPRGVAFLRQLSPTVAELPPDCWRIQRLAFRLRLMILSLGAVVVGCALVLRGA